MPHQILHVAKSFATSHLILGTYVAQVQCNTAESFTTPCWILHAIESFAMPCFVLCVTECFATSHLILAMSLDQVQDHAAKFLLMPCMILHAAKFFATPHLILGMLFHVLKVLAIETKSQKLISYTSGVAHAKVITTGETTTPSLLVTALPSMDDFIAGDSHAHDLL